MRRKLRSEIVDALGDRLVLIESVEVQGDAIVHALARERPQRPRHPQPGHRPQRPPARRRDRHRGPSGRRRAAARHLPQPPARLRAALPATASAPPAAPAGGQPAAPAERLRAAGTSPRSRSARPSPWCSTSSIVPNGIVPIRSCTLSRSVCSSSVSPANRMTASGSVGSWQRPRRPPSRARARETPWGCAGRRSTSSPSPAPCRSSFGTWATSVSPPGSRSDTRASHPSDGDPLDRRRRRRPPRVDDHVVRTHVGGRGRALVQVGGAGEPERAEVDVPVDHLPVQHVGRADEARDERRGGLVVDLARRARPVRRGPRA